MQAPRQPAAASRIRISRTSVTIVRLHAGNKLCGGVATFVVHGPLGMSADFATSIPEVAHDPERPCREAEAPVEGRLQGPALRGNADPASRLVVPALSAQLS